MKRIKPTLSLLVIAAIGFAMNQCQHEDEAIIPIKGPDPVVHGTEIINCTGCTPLAGDSYGTTADFSSGSIPSGVWYHDKAHSNVMWETQYKQFGSLLTGRFNYFVLITIQAIC